MKKILTAIAAVAFSGALCQAAPCGTGTLASYLALSASGCTLAGSTLSDFQTVPGTSGATPIGPAGVNISPLGGASDPGFTLSTSLTAMANAPLELIFTYKIAGLSYSGSAVSLSHSSETVDGGVTEIENYCAGGTFGPDGVSGCTGSTGSLLALDGIQQSDQNSFAAVPFVSVTDDFELDGGLAGSASGGTFTNQFTAAASSNVPEPASWLFAGLALCGATGLKLRRASICYPTNPQK